MKFVTFVAPAGEPRAGWLQGDALVVDMYAVSGGVLPQCMMAFLADAEANLERARELSARLEGDPGFANRPGVYDRAAVRLLAPLPRPASVRDFYAFEAHVKTARARRGLEMVPQWYEFPVFYFSNHQAVVGPDAEVEVPPRCEAFDYELELACVIGRKGRDIAATDAASYIFGYCILNDWSARDIQREEVKVGLGPAKGKDFATSLGPWLVTPDELEPYRMGDRYNLEMTAAVNGRVLSRGNYRDIYYPMASLVEHAARGTTLYPGDVIGTGTVGTGCILELGPETHRWLQPGDEIVLEVTGLGTLRNTVVAGPNRE
ncbi:MAG: fumarylacetoacetate hydrolase family protein [Alicyclobacillus mali]|uniref:fumarylacetoacetate hydrolase family protein n=1 Tax=Alicyclobacillus mali (ex Roth et al. 2021) TaxID=1123961 RepID=UPI0023F1C649|nr:fumarylacetoacetate hydrolase family protein [Alicyclobacillus mali (ex Roth et al. 2021)]MCL6487378.1 fumarylacetoacetate hydrolase family protein [Alicyclobacillus mali (ex Roth et al. 2021)]